MQSSFKWALTSRRTALAAVALMALTALSCSLMPAPAAPPADGQVTTKDDAPPSPAGGPGFRRKFWRDGEGGKGTADGGESDAPMFQPGGGRFRRFRGRGFPGDGEGGFGRGGGQGMPPMMRQRLRNRMGGEGGLFGRRPLDLTSLNLSDEQKQKIQALREQNKTKARALRSKLQERKSELRDLMFDANSSDDQIRAKRRELRQMQDKAEEMQINDFLAIRSVLTPEQRVKLVDLKPGANRVAGSPAGEGARSSDSSDDKAASDAAPKGRERAKRDSDKSNDGGDDSNK